MLELSGVGVQYGGVRAVSEVNLTLAAATLVSIVGANGAGKSTLLKAISGLVPLTTGRISLNGEILTGLPPYRIAAAGVAHVPERRRLFPSMSVKDNLLLGAYTIKGSHRRHQIMEQVCTLFPELGPKLDAKASTLSGGQQQMVAIGRGLMSDPKLLLLDEPSLGLAPIVVQRLFESIRTLRDRRSMAILLVEQNVELSLRIADWGVVLQNGCVTLSGPSSDLLGSDLIRKAFLGL